MKKSSLTIIVVLCCTLSGVCQQVTIQEATNAAVNTMRYYGRNNISNSSIDSVSDIEPYHFGFRYKASKEIIDRETLATMLDAEMFASYSKARNERIVALPLWIVSGVGLSASAYFAFMGLDDCLHPSPVDYENPMMPAAPFLFVASGVLFAATLAPMIPAIILTIDSKKRLNGIASSFNTKGREPISIEFGGINNGIGFAINF